MAVAFIQRADGTPGRPPQDLIVSFSVNLAVASLTPVDGNIFIADQDYEVVRVAEAHSTAGAASSTLDVKKCTGTTAPASGTTVLASTFALDSTANTPVVKNTASGLSATQANRRITSGDRLALDFTGTVSAYVGCIVVHLRRLGSANDNIGF